MAPQTIVQFHTRHGVFNAHEKAHFPKIVADQLIKAGVASYIGEAGPRKSVPVEDAPKLRK